MRSQQPCYGFFLPVAGVLQVLLILLFVVSKSNAFVVVAPSTTKTIATARILPVHQQQQYTPRQHTQLHAATSTTATVQDFEFEGHKIYSEVYYPTNAQKKKKNDVILIHGFGCSTVYWRATIITLTKAGFTVHALDLLGQGKSAKPGRSTGIEYSIRLWAKQVDEYAQQFISASSQDIVLMGNSLGSVVALTAAVGDYTTKDDNDNDGETAAAFIPQRINGVGMYNCGVGMNSRNVLLEFDDGSLQKVIFTVLFDVLDALIFGNLPLLTYVLDKVVTTELLKDALTGLYKYGEDRVDEELVNSFYLPAKDVGSPECLSQIYTNDAGATPMQLYEDYATEFDTLPVHLIWGTDDPVTPISGSVGTFFKKQAADASSPVSIDTLEAGHVPFDEVPECNDLMLNWLERVEADTTTTAAGAGMPNVFGDMKIPFFGN